MTRRDWHDLQAMIPLSDDNPTELTPVFTYSLIVACVLAFLWQISHDARIQQQIVLSLGVIPVTLLTDVLRPPLIAWVPDGVTVFTSMFLHGGWMHLLGNMLYLWIFADNVEDAMGHVRFIFFYLICGVIAVLAHAIPDAGSTVPMIGASGAISGVLGAYLLLYPHARVLVLIPIGFIMQTVRIPAGWVLGFWFVVQIFSSSISSGEGGGVAWGAHIGGFVAGMVLVLLFKRKNVPLFHPRIRS